PPCAPAVKNYGRGLFAAVSLGVVESVGGRSTLGSTCGDVIDAFPALIHVEPGNSGLPDAFLEQGANRFAIHLIVFDCNGRYSVYIAEFCDLEGKDIAGALFAQGFKVACGTKRGKLRAVGGPLLGLRIARRHSSRLRSNSFQHPLNLPW